MKTRKWKSVEEGEGEGEQFLRSEGIYEDVCVYCGVHIRFRKSVFESNGMESPSKFFLGSNLILDLGSIIESDLSKKRKSEPN